MYRFRKAITAIFFCQLLLAVAAEPEYLVFKDSFENCAAIGTVKWDGGGDGSSWADPQNWVNDTLPVDGDSVSIRDNAAIIVVYDKSLETTRIDCLDSNESLQITGGILEIDGKGWVRPVLTITAGTLGVNGKLAVLGALQQDGGTLKGVGTVTVTGLFTWTRGIQSEPGETIANGGLSLSGTTTRDLQSRTLTLNAATNWTGGDLRLWKSATINNNGPFDIKTDADMPLWSNPASTFNNNATLNKLAGSDVTKIVAAINNAGTVTVSSGDLWLGHTSSSGASSGLFEVSSGSILGISGTNNMTGDSAFAGAGGFLRVVGGTTTIQGSYLLSGPLEVKNGTLIFANPVTFSDDVTVKNGILEYTQPTSVNANVLISGGTLTAPDTLLISGTLEQTGGILKGVGTVTVSGLFTWTGGAQAESGETIANGGLSLSGTTTRDLQSRTLTLNAATNWTGGDLRLWKSATINNNALFDIKTDADMPLWSNPVSTFNNN